MMNIEKSTGNTNLYKTWVSPHIEDYSDIKKGDMPGDKININENHVAKATTIYRELMMSHPEIFDISSNNKTIISVYGGSGVGKSEIGSLLAYNINKMNIGTYILSGDNYPHRIPKKNDAERVRIYREQGLKGMVIEGLYSEKRHKILKELQAKDIDSDATFTKEYPWLNKYQSYGAKGLCEYLGTQSEIDFKEISSINKVFKEREKSIYLKRMGREEEELWYESIDFSNIKVLIIEWTHGNNDLLECVDLPILLNSTPQETLEHRKMRNRDGAIDSSFTSMVLEIEQKLLISQACKAKMIVARDGQLISYEQLCKQMNL